MNTISTFLRPGIDHAAFSVFLDEVQAAREERRRHELVAWSRETGQPLPMPSKVIVTLEDAGAVVDLESGWIRWPNGVEVLPDRVVMKKA
jgi:hypothetical protein